MDEMVAEVKHSGELQWTLRGKLKDTGDCLDVWKKHSVCVKDLDKLFIKRMNDMMAHLWISNKSES